MHASLLGVCRQVLKLWLESKHSKELWYIGNKFDDLDKRLCTIKPPVEIKRTPRSLKTTRKFWKGIKSCTTSNKPTNNAQLLHHCMASTIHVVKDVAIILVGTGN